MGRGRYIARHAEPGALASSLPILPQQPGPQPTHDRRHWTKPAPYSRPAISASYACQYEDVAPTGLL